MNVIINKDISKIKETMFFGLPMRETLLSAATVAIGVISHALLYEYVINDNLLRILSALCCVPTAYLALYKYQGMRGEKIILEVIRSLMLKDTVVLTAENIYSNQAKELVKVREKEGLKNDKVAKKQKRRKKAELQGTEESAGYNSVHQNL